MPRVHNTGPSVDRFCEETGNGASNHDVCAECCGPDELLPPMPELQPYNGDPPGEEGWEAGADHPCYSECDYKCAICGKKLTEEDN